MKRLLLLLVPTIVLALGAFVVAFGEDAPPEPTPADQSKNFKRNAPLIEALVDGSVRLAKEQDDHLKRADYCNGVARKFADEMRTAAQSGDGSRAVELSLHFRDLLERGVALNLRAAHGQIPLGSAREPEFFQVGDSMILTTKTVEEELRNAPADPAGGDDMQQALKAVYEGRTNVEGALKSRPRPTGKKN